MRKLLLGGVAALCLSLGACNSGADNAVNQAVSNVQSGVATATQLLNNVCASAPANATTVAGSPLASVASNLMGFLSGTCQKGVATSAIVNAAVSDPNGIQNTVNWAINLVTMLKGVLG